MLKVPWLTFMELVSTMVFAVVTFTVPAPNLFKLKYWFPVGVVEEVALLFKLIVAPEAVLKFNARPVVVRLLMPPLMLSVPASAPMTASKGITRAPVTVLVPDTFCNWPPKLIPPEAWLLFP